MPIRFLLFAALFAVAFWGFRRWFGGYARTPTAEALAPREWALVAATADALFPAGGVIPPSGSEAGVPAYVDHYVASVPSSVRLLMRLLFAMFEQATLFFPAPGRGGRRRFSGLSVDQQVAVLEGWRSSGLFPRRLVFTSLRAIMSMGYLADPAVLRQLDLAPLEFTSPVAAADLLYPPVGRPRSEIRHHETTAPSDGTPHEIGGPIHHAYREGAE